MGVSELFGPDGPELEVMNGYLVARGVNPVEYPAGAGYGPMPGSDAEPIVQLSTLPGWPSVVDDLLTEEALEHWRYLASHRERYGSGACVCHMCASLPAICRVFGIDPEAVPGE